MHFALLAPAAATVLCLVVLAWSMARVDVELRALRASLRRSRAAAVATDDLQRATRTVVEEVQRIDHDTRARAHVRRTRRSSTAR
ncbi:MAG: hypothetical protein DHS20C19_25310 [Acidimicrobiales bacterium]|nr:MAG: hypothetical protein DHS20C19_25310 [Acidimicrobiales bacterium]